jgi:Ca2+-binding EF-hand superfamily protein
MRDIYANYCGKFAEKEEIERILNECPERRLGWVSYTTFVQKKSESQIAMCKLKVRNVFKVYDQKRTGIEYFSQAAST